MDISIIVPIYNVENYIHKCIDSILNCNLKEYEILCVNDGSTDSSKEIIESYVNRYPNIVKLLNKKNGGLSDARNYALDYCKGKYIGFVDADDWCSNNMFKILLEKALSDDLDIVVCDYIEEYEEYSMVIKENNSKYSLLFEAPVWNKIFKKTLFIEHNIKFPKGLWYEDNGTTYKLLAVTNNIGYINKALYHYRKNRPGSIMSSQKSSKIYDIYGIGDTLYDFYKKNVEDNEKFEQLEYIFIKNILFRQIPKILIFEFPNVITMLKKINMHYKYIEQKFPYWYKNNIFIKDEDSYFRNKVGSNHVNKIKYIKVYMINIILFNLMKR
ncbi:glycosyltransferase family 2 protein [Clostridium intestinale]|uniref:Glycosyltransferase involved in cell wall bisynthesis n=1 Tax=Clostridium intestinale DSM 6191 TaxID=1121320 RepID=A0A1M6DLB3_9CLOT|nr:glycosyltransferase [Clostridium intestinale]SHI73933.1 Glycosyltransferase involved in cell wall bisynthesis [Clostridium intestinale DSM 6191]